MFADSTSTKKIRFAKRRRTSKRAAPGELWKKNIALPVCTPCPFQCELRRSLDPVSYALGELSKQRKGGGVLRAQRKGGQTTFYESLEDSSFPLTHHPNGTCCVYQRGRGWVAAGEGRWGRTSRKGGGFVWENLEASSLHTRRGGSDLWNAGGGEQKFFGMEKTRVGRRRANEPVKLRFGMQRARASQSNNSPSPGSSLFAPIFFPFRRLCDSHAGLCTFRCPSGSRVCSRGHTFLPRCFRGYV